MASKNEKIIQEISGMSIMDLANLVKDIETTFGVSAAAPVAAASAATAAAPAAEEKTNYKVNLKEAGAEKVKVIKALRQVLPALNLTDAKKLVEEAPSVIAESVSKDDAQKIKKELEAAGAKVELA
jgi:large subunit ribosomal protein L7/L12